MAKFIDKMIVVVFTGALGLKKIEGKLKAKRDDAKEVLADIKRKKLERKEEKKKLLPKRLTIKKGG